jgi:hypothetical protein
MLVGCVSFDWHQGRLFFHIGDACCYLICMSVSYPFDTTRSLSPQKLGHSYSDNNTRSLSSEGHSLDLCAQMSPPACPFAAASCVRYEDCATAKEARADVDRAILRASDPPPRPCSPRRMSSSRWKLIDTFY